MSKKAINTPDTMIDAETGQTYERVSLAYSGFPKEPQIPAKMENYTPFGNYEKVLKIVQSRKFHPTWMFGLPGCGKTAAIIQACAVAGRELIRANITAETTRDDLIGGFRLAIRPGSGNSNPESIFTYGPIAEGMRRGAVVLLDEIDLGTSKLMCLQPILETSQSVFIQSINEMVKAKPGFTIFATSNTKGGGNANGAYAGANTMNKAMLDRFAMAIEQDYPDQSTECELLKGKLQIMGLLDDYTEDFVVNLVEWADKSRQDYKESGGTNEFISMRRLEMILMNYSVVKNRMEAINDAIALYDDSTVKGFISAYRALDDNCDVLNDGKKGKRAFRSKKTSRVEIDPNDPDMFS